MPVGPEVTQVIDRDWLNYAFSEIDGKLNSKKWVSEHRMESFDGKTQCWEFFLLARASASASTIAELAEAYKKVGWTEVIPEVFEESGRPAMVSVLLKFYEK